MPKSGTAKPTALCGGCFGVPLAALVGAEVTEHLFDVHATAGPRRFSACFASYLATHNGDDSKCPYI